MRRVLLYFLFLSLSSVFSCKQFIEIKPQYEMRIISGNYQRGAIGEPLGDSLVVQVIEQGGLLPPRLNVTFEVLRGGGTLNGQSMINRTTDRLGQAKVQWILGDTSALQMVLAKLSLEENIIAKTKIFQANAKESNYHLNIISGNTQTGIINEELPQPLIVQVTDLDSRIVSGAIVKFTSGNIVDNGMPQEAEVETNSIGLAENYWTLGSKTDSQRMEVSLVIPNAGTQVLPKAEFKAFALTNCPVTFIDNRDAKIYQAVRIGNQCWMAENLNIGSMINYMEIPELNSGIQKHCYLNRIENCDQYGGLYNWFQATQQNICPEGWKAPSDNDFKELERFLGIEEQELMECNFSKRGKDQAYQLISRSENCPECVNSYDSGFNALFSGECIGTLCNGKGTFARFLTITESDINNMIVRTINPQDTGRIECRTKDKGQSLSVRCLKM